MNNNNIFTNKRMHKMKFINSSSFIHFILENSKHFRNFYNKDSRLSFKVQKIFFFSIQHCIMNKKCKKKSKQITNK